MVHKTRKSRNIRCNGVNDLVIRSTAWDWWGEPVCCGPGATSPESYVKSQVARCSAPTGLDHYSSTGQERWAGYLPSAKYSLFRDTSGLRTVKPQPTTLRALTGTILIILLLSFASAQDLQFAFDTTGNLQAQSAETLAHPQIVAQPQPQVVGPGALASFFVVAANTHNLTYQWQFNGDNIIGATGDALLLQNVGALSQGFYSVVLVNSSGSVTSAPAALMLDGDRDGLPDSWEQTYFGGLSQKPSGDLDGDGVSNQDEFLQGTNPADSASVLFRLTVISDGGQVTVNPGRFTFTNGEVVTLTAIALPSGTFHGWRGATNTTENSITLTMDGNKTVYAYLGSYDITWTNTVSGDWNIASNWSPDFVPGTNDNVFITSSATVTLNTNATCGSLTLSAGTLAGSGALTLHRDSAWSSGTMTGAGRTILPPGATLNLNGTGTKTLSGGRILENGGTVYWNAGNIQAATATVITNRAGALFQVQSATGITPGAGGGRFDNAGIFRKTSAGTTTINNLVSFNNYGAVEIKTGTLAFAGVSLNDGAMDVSAGATLNFSAGTFTSSGGSSIVGAGNLAPSGGIVNLAGLVNVTGSHTFTFATANLTGNYICTNNTLTISGSPATFSGTGTVTPAVLNLSGGSLGGSQQVTVLNQMNWTGGTMTGSGRTVIPPGATLTINAGSVGVGGGRTLDNGGTTIWEAGQMSLASLSVITNRPGALFLMQSSATIVSGLSGGRLDNAGMFRKTSAGTTTLNDLVTFNNYGAVELQSGTLSLAGGGLNNGTMVVSPGTTLNFSGGNYTSSGGSSIVGEGNLTLSSGIVNLAGLVNVTGPHTFTFATANLTGNYICTNNTLTISGATATFSGTGTVTPAVLNLSGGSLGGNQLVTVLSQMNWTGGSMSGSGRTVIPPGVTLTINAGFVGISGGRTLDNGGTAFWNAGTMQIATATVFTNRLGALFQVQSAAAITPGGGGGRFDNAGTFRKTSAGTTTLNDLVTFNNYGAVELQSGTLSLTGGGLNNGTMVVSPGTTLNLSGGTFTSSAAASITGAGNLTVSSSATPTLAGLVNVSGTNTFSAGTANLTGNYICTNNTMTISGAAATFSGTGTVSPAVINLSSGTLGGNQLVTVLSQMNWSGGTMTGVGRTVMSPGATLNITGAATKTLSGGRILDNGGTTLWTAGNIQAATATIITNRAGALFQVQSAAGITPGAGGGRFDNAGTFRKTSAGTNSIDALVRFNNYGTVELQTGILAANGGYTSTTNALLHYAISGTTPGTGYGRLQVSGTVTLNGALGVGLVNGFLPTTNDTFTVLSAGTRSGTFASFHYPSNAVTMQLSNTVNSVIVSVSEVLAVPQPVLLPAEISGPDILLSWTAVSNLTYRLEFNPDLNPANWTGLAGDILSLSNTASRLEALPSSNRFYRVRVVP